MNKKIIKLFVFLIVLGGFVSLSTIGFYEGNKDVVYQVATINSLLEGVYDSNSSLENIVHKNSLGIGTFNSLDGEMIILKGKIYKAGSDGKVYSMPDNVVTPFASVVDFSCDKKIVLPTLKDLSSLEKQLDKKLSLKNSFYAFKMEGLYDFIKVRSVPKQQKPYRPLVEVVKEQAVFTKENVRGTVVGFRLPEFVGGLNVPGYHLHFISDDKKFGGHLLELSSEELTVCIDKKNQLLLTLPSNKSFQDAKIDMTGKNRQLEQVEK